ncbi:hypothetical protein MOQ72_18365 [Saccharopolyspora sp. K220]|uniref:hypothetical protein n=1 Tax=Saccharopolyspora soli TaxID=2926618 RepID=UPI001F599FC0|nr:hypothetical protein [Saccharopolyspora soli]MCI2419409.1 hypothetical protein [Saccharopolyspora soli]
MIDDFATGSNQASHVRLPEMTARGFFHVALTRTVQANLFVHYSGRVAHLMADPCVLWQTGHVRTQTYEFYYGPGIPAPVAA